jgi:single-strand selective monofunctional uracil DNA glycosylase
MKPDLDCLESIANDLVKALRPLKFGPPITHVYNPLEYARESLMQYHKKLCF